MKTTKPLLGGLMSALIAVAALWPATCLAELSDVDSEAIELLRRTTDYLAGFKEFRVETDTTIEIVTSSGQKLQLGTLASVTIQRPNKMRAERVGEFLRQIVFYYDGKSLTMSHPDDGYYATVAAPPTLEAMLDFARTSLDIIAPASDLVYKNAFERLTEGLTSAFVVEKAVVGNVRCDHIAFRNPEVDWQIWIQEGDKPLPRKFIVTSKKMVQSPQFVMVLSKWEAAPKITQATFNFVPPKKHTEIDFILVPPAGAAKK
jgi:hypothetical protein